MYVGGGGRESGSLDALLSLSQPSQAGVCGEGQEILEGQDEGMRFFHAIVLVSSLKHG